MSIRVPLWVVIIGGIVLAALLRPGLIRFWPFSAAEFVQLITPLVLVSLFIERTLEVFLTAWRAPGSDKINRQVKRLAAAPGVKAGNEEVEDARDELVAYKSETQRVAFVAALALGVGLSALGVRALELFVDPAAFKALSSTQRGIFTGADVLLTGAVLGGGSEALHKLVSVFTGFMDKSAKGFKGEP